MGLEGYFDARGHVEPEGPYGEFLGYYGALKRNPVFHLTANHASPRRAVPDLDDRGRTMSCTIRRSSNSVRTEVMIWRALEGRGARAARRLCDALERRHAQRTGRAAPAGAGEARNAIAACLGALANIKNVFIAIRHRTSSPDQQIGLGAGDGGFQPDPRPDGADRHAQPCARPVADHGRVGAKAGFDLTWPFGSTARLENQRAGAAALGRKRFASIEAALATARNSSRN